MRVAIEAASLALTSGGLPRYTSELSLALARFAPLHEAAGVQRALEPELGGGEQRVGDGAGAVVALVLDLAWPTT